MIAILIILGIIGIWTSATLYLQKYDEDDYAVSFGFSIGAMVFFSIVFTILNFTIYYNQISDFEELLIIDDKIEIYENRTNQLTEDLKLVLIDTYKEHEKGMFSNMGADNLSLLLIKYPELRASETFIEYSKQIRQLNDDKYKMELGKISIGKRLNVRKRHPLVIKQILPKQ